MRLRLDNGSRERIFRWGEDWRYLSELKRSSPHASAHPILAFLIKCLDDLMNAPRSQVFDAGSAANESSKQSAGAWPPAGGMEKSDDLAEVFSQASPFPHLVIDNFFPPARVHAIAKEVGTETIDPEAPDYGFKGKRRNSDLATFPPEARAMVEELNSREFISWLERVTGIEGLHPDPDLHGGGLHQIPPGGYLGVHTDFNWHHKLNMHRRLNLLLYLNENWNEDWGGALELWTEDQIEADHGSAAVSLMPLFNRVVIFATTDFSYHGHPHKLACPPDRTRNSIALYYYSKDRPESEIRFGESKLTNYRAMAGKTLGFRHRVHQSLLKHEFLRKLLRR